MSPIGTPLGGRVTLKVPQLSGTKGEAIDWSYEGLILTDQSTMF